MLESLMPFEDLLLGLGIVSRAALGGEEAEELNRVEIFRSSVGRHIFSSSTAINEVTGGL